MFENLLWKLKRKGFYIDLDEDYAFPGKKGAVRPNVYVMQAAIENYNSGTTIPATASGTTVNTI